MPVPQSTAKFVPRMIRLSAAGGSAELKLQSPGNDANFASNRDGTVSDRDSIGKFLDRPRSDASAAKVRSPRDRNVAGSRSLTVTALSCPPTTCLARQVKFSFWNGASTAGGGIGSGRGQAVARGQTLLSPTVGSRGITASDRSRAPVRRAVVPRRCRATVWGKPPRRRQPAPAHRPRVGHSDSWVR